MMPFDQVNTSLSFLRAIEQAEPVGLDTKGATQALGTVHRNSIGSKTPIINRQLRRNGYSPDEVYRSQRTPGGNFWRAGPKLARRLPRWNRTGDSAGAPREPLNKVLAGGRRAVMGTLNDGHGRVARIQPALVPVSTRGYRRAA